MTIFIKRYPLPVFALFGLLSGLLFWFGWPVLSTWIWRATLVFGGIPIVFQTVRGMLKGKFASDIVAMLAIIAAFLLDQAFAGAMIVLMQSGGEAIEEYGLRRASYSLTALLERAPKRARRKKGERLEEIDVQEVKIGDTLIVRPGDLVPVDGTVVEGNAEIDESAITGEPLARSKKGGDSLLSGSVALNGAIEMRADRPSKESQYAKIVKLVKIAQEEKAPIQRLADRYAIYFTPLTLFMGAVGYWITNDPTTILSVLVVATPCPLILATPLAVICGINRAADSAIIVKGGAALEQAASAKGVLFDKTGTITYGTPFVEKIVSLQGKSEQELLFDVASLEQYSSHSIGKAIVQHAQTDTKTLLLPKNFHESTGRGIEGQIDGKHYIVGSASFMEDQIGKMDLPGHGGKLQIYVACNGRLEGYLVLADKIRPNIPKMVDELRSLGVEKIAIVTGDSQSSGEAIAKQAGIETVFADLKPEKKVEIVKEMDKAYYPSLMVGDGINDAPAIATATVGIAMGAHGTAISAEAADIVFLADDIQKVPETIRIGKRMIHIAKQSILIGIGLSFILMCFAAAGFIIPAIGAILQEIIDVAVILNALRARH